MAPSSKSLARGFRAPNGMGIGPNGEITVGDNEGTWTPICPINWIKPGGFYGVPDFAGKPKAEFPTVRDNPLCWLPHDEVDNSNGGQVWITSKKFGPLSGQLLHASYGQCKLYDVLKEEVGGQMQGGVTPIPLKFDTRHLPNAVQREGRTPSISSACAAGRRRRPRMPASTAFATPARKRTCPSI